jgi:hypothetical protein
MLKLPYADFALSLDGEQRLAKYVVDGKGRPEPSHPLTCPKWLGTLMRECWEELPGRRPTFKGIVVRACVSSQLALIQVMYQC